MKILITFLALIPCMACASYPVFREESKNPFAKVPGPVAGAAHIYGSYAAGCLVGGQSILNISDKLISMRPSRRRYFAHPVMANLLQRADASLPHRGPLLLGDVGQARGGPTPTGHTSHQIGLDLDVWFSPDSILRGDPLPRNWKETLSAQSVVDPSYRSLNQQRWDRLFGEQLLWFAGQSEVARIFINVVIKMQMCKDYPNDARLAKLRPWYYHEEHFHVRLTCPANEADCKNQDPPSGIGCDDSDFAYWLSPEVIGTPGYPPVSTPQPATAVQLPDACRWVAKYKLAY